MELENLKLEDRQKREREYYDFMRLYRGYDDILDPSRSNETATVTSAQGLSEREGRIDDLDRAVFDSPYIRQFNRSALNAAFAKLETGLAASPGVPISLDALGQKRRRVCFLHRFAQIVRWQDYEHQPPKPKALGNARKRIARLCQELESLLLDQLNDEHLIRKLHNNDLAALPELIKGLDQFGDVFETVKPDYPVQRNRELDNTVLRLVLNDLAECCYQVYENCDYEVVRQLLKSCWLRHYASTRKGELEKMIELSRERKITSYYERTAERDEDRSTPEFPWTPVRSL
ncbi:MAG: hypothetical protein JSS57_05450 [Proteobacteria bacterium]|nr:hypothetical protein [Pseudomonadota bacterium]